MDWTFYAAAAPAVILMGIGKAGLSGLGGLSVPILSLAISPIEAAAITLPILIVQDWVGVFAFRRDMDRRNLTILLPGGLVGVVLAFFFAAHLSEAAVRLAIGLISVGFVVLTAVRDRLARVAAARADVAPGLFWGAVAGFASFVSHAGGPPFLVYAMPQRLEPKVFAGTSSLFFAALNLMKAPPYLALGQFTRAHLTASASLLPLAVAATLAGVWIVRRVPPAKFYTLVLMLTLALGVKLTYDGLRALGAF